MCTQHTCNPMSSLLSSTHIQLHPQFTSPTALHHIPSYHTHTSLHPPHPPYPTHSSLRPPHPPYPTHSSLLSPHSTLPHPQFTPLTTLHHTHTHTTIHSTELHHTTSYHYHISPTLDSTHTPAHSIITTPTIHAFHTCSI